MSVHFSVPYLSVCPIEPSDVLTERYGTEKWARRETRSFSTDQLFFARTFRNSQAHAQSL